MLVCCNCVAFSATSVCVTEANIYENKISPNLQSNLDKLDEDDEVKVAVWLYDIEEEAKDSAVANKLKEELDKVNISSELYSRSALLQSESVSKSEQMSIKDIQTLLSIKRSSYKELHIDRNVRWKNSIDKNLSTSKIIYSSIYAPVVILEVAKSELKKLALLDKVEYIYPCEEPKEPFDNKFQYERSEISSESVDYGVWQNITDINAMRDESGYDGSGIKIGLLENGLPEINHSSGVFINSSVIPVNNVPVDVHATYMASILVGKTNDYTGVAPNAQLYCAGFNHGYIGPIETLIDNNINILSISLALGYSSGIFNTYGNYSKYLDYIIYNYNITVCHAAGNYSTNPGVPEGAMGYNLITVGNLDDKNTSTNVDDEIRSTSSYVTINTEAYKPDLCAPGARVGTPVYPEKVSDGLGGTSAATPVVAGICAMLMQSDTSLIAKPMLLKSALMSSTKRVPNMGSITSTSTTTAPALSRSYGAGLVNVSNTYSVLKSEKWKYIPLVSQEQNKNPYTMNVVISQNDINSSKKVAVCLTWTQKVISASLNSSTVYNVYHHDLRVYKPNGNLVAHSNYQSDRKQFVYFKPTVAGTYKIKVYKTGTSQAGVLTAITYKLC